MKYRLYALLLLVLVSCGKDEDSQNEIMSVDVLQHNLATDWFELQLELTLNSPGYVPPVVSRAFGYTSLTFYEAMVNGMQDYKSIYSQLNESIQLPDITNQDLYWPAVGNAAMAQMVRYMFDNTPDPLLPKIESLEKLYEEQFKIDISEDQFIKSVNAGKDLANSIYEWSKTDGGHRAYNRLFPGSYIPPSGDGLWKPTNSGRALLPFWGKNRTFLAGINDAAEPINSPIYSTDPDSDFYKEAYDLYTMTNNLSDEQKLIAYFWADDPLVTYTPPGHSVYILTQVLKQEKKNLTFAAQAYLLLGLAQADAFISCWNTKYTTNVMRPITYIQENIDPLWTSYIITPPFPEYTSGHSTQSGASARILTHLFGDNYVFVDRTHATLSLQLPNRTFSSFYQMAEEVGVSRIYGGIHFEMGNQEGRKQGFRIADMILNLPIKVTSQ